MGPNCHQSWNNRFDLSNNNKNLKIDLVDGKSARKRFNGMVRVFKKYQKRRPSGDGLDFMESQISGDEDEFSQIHEFSDENKPSYVDSLSFLSDALKERPGY